MHSKVTTKTFEGQSFYIGIDVHKQCWKVTILSDHYEHKTFSQDPSPQVLIKYLQNNFPKASFQAVYEAGFSGFTACRELREGGIDCEVIHPADVPTSLKEKLMKSDKVDSRKLARSLRAGELSPIDVPDIQLEADRALIRQRERLAKDISRIKNRVKSLLFQFNIQIPEPFTQAQTRHWSKNYILWIQDLAIEQIELRHTLDNYLETGLLLRKQLLKVNKQIRALMGSKRYKKNFELLLGIPGVGIHSAAYFLTHIGNIARFKRLDDLCSFVGLIPRTNSSGEKVQAGKLVNRGRKGIKIMLIEVAWVAIRKDPALMHKFNELSRRMKKNKAIIRIARKILSRVRHVLLHQQPYEIGVMG